MAAWFHSRINDVAAPRSVFGNPFNAENFREFGLFIHRNRPPITRFCLTLQQWTLIPAWSRDHQSQWPCAFPRSHHFFGPQPRYTRFYYMFNVLLLAPSDPPNTSMTPQRLLYTLSLRLVSTIATPCWLERQGPSSPTGFNRCSTRLSVWSVEPGSSIAACPNCLTPSYIGWTFHNVSSINSESQFTGVWPFPLTCVVACTTLSHYLASTWLVFFSLSCFWRINMFLITGRTATVHNSLPVAINCLKPDSYCNVDVICNNAARLLNCYTCSVIPVSLSVHRACSILDV